MCSVTTKFSLSNGLNVCYHSQRGGAFNNRSVLLLPRWQQTYRYDEDLDPLVTSAHPIGAAEMFVYSETVHLLEFLHLKKVILFLNPLFPPSDGPRLFCRSSHLEDQREAWEERRSALRQVHIRWSQWSYSRSKIGIYFYSAVYQPKLVFYFLRPSSTGVPQETQGCQEEAEDHAEELRIVGVKFHFTGPEKMMDYFSLMVPQCVLH